jgi:hypothetical protein
MEINRGQMDLPERPLEEVRPAAVRPARRSRTPALSA